ncbi:MAG TPA: hypothetical protein VIV54_08205 [Burkholderiales bacterium]
MEPCTVEVGLLRKKPCGHPSVAKCANCEQPLCAKHAVAQVSAAGKKTGTFLCAPCNAADKLYQQTAPAATPAATPPAEKPAAPAPKPAAPAQKPAAPAQKPAAPVAKAAPPPEKKPEPSPDDTSAPLEFTPSKKPEAPKK